MEDLPNPNSPPHHLSSLPPGFRFRPTSKQLLCFYLFNHNNNNPSTSHHHFFGFDLIREFDLYNYNPFDLSETDSFPFGHGGSKKHWYFFTTVKGKGGRRKAKGGFWQSKERVRDVLGGNVVLGTKRSFVFYRGDLTKSSRTNWIMIEYSLVDYRKDSFVVCRVYLKSRGNNVAVLSPNFYAEERTAVMHNNCNDVPYKQHDVARKSGFAEVVPQEVDSDNVTGRVHSRMTSVSDDVAVAGLVSDDGFGSSLGFPQTEQLMISTKKIISGSVLFNDAVEDDLLNDSTILEGDFIELDDLLCPLLGDDP
ncbi:hypothetical protein GIB67_016276 [Kingdonia uniflora]|uniref:NAC domain-containing protein n=1 Tax=Kingdonia uniflora TaxID=39325 RepID=A0A7J7M9L7_9MAGN|nr:hypothetical protein GIB67_016276 [Kingdonia uniflora]